jgi:hypothetical protein
MIWFQCFDVTSDDAIHIRSLDPDEPGLAQSITEESSSISWYPDEDDPGQDQPPHPSHQAPRYPPTSRSRTRSRDYSDSDSLTGSGNLNADSLTGSGNLNADHLSEWTRSRSRSRDNHSDSDITVPYSDDQESSATWRTRTPRRNVNQKHDNPTGQTGSGSTAVTATTASSSSTGPTLPISGEDVPVPSDDETVDYGSGDEDEEGQKQLLSWQY